MIQAGETQVSNGSHLDPRLMSVVDEISDRIQHGQSVNIEEYVREFPDRAEYLRQLVRTLEDLAELGRSSGETKGGLLQPQNQQIGDFRILGELGRGGMGTVFEAEQFSMGRRVALKVLQFAALAQDKALQRFRNEVRAAAALDHPHIVSVYSVGEERGIHYYSMQLIRGQSLAGLVWQMRRERSGMSASRAEAAQNGRTDEAPTIDSQIAVPPSTQREEQARLSTAVDSRPDRESYRTAARLGIQAAEALEHAHNQGVLHRDIKPGNLLLDAEGKVYVTDFGLARIEADAGLTMTGDIIGTLRYMAPEQALAKRVVIDHRADIYSLGATLYELLTLQPAFGESDRSELLKQIAFEEPRPLRKLDRHIPAELQTIVLKAMAKNPDERYQTAQELAGDLKRYLNDQPIQARPPTAVQRIAKWSRRHVGIVWTAVAASLLLSLVLATATTLVANSRRAAIVDRERAEAETNNAVTQRNEARLQQYYAEVVSGQTDLAEGNLGRLQQKLLRHLPVADEPDYRGWEWYYLFSHCHNEVKTLTDPRRRDVSSSWSPDGEMISTPGAIWRSDSGECVRYFTPSLNGLCRVAWSPDSQLLAWSVTSDDGAIYLWDRRTDELRQLRGQKQSVWAISFSPDGKQLASGSSDNTVKIWDPAMGVIRDSYTVDHHVTDVTWSPDGKFLAALGMFGPLYVWEAASGNEVLRHPIDDGSLCESISWRPDGSRLAMNTSINWYILDCRDWSEAVKRRHSFSRNFQSVIGHGAWSPSGDRLAVPSGSNVEIWDAAGEIVLATLAGHVEHVESVSWSPEGDRLATTDARGETRIWEVRAPSQPPPILTGSPIERVVWASDGNKLSSVATKSLTTSTWRINNAERLDEVSPRINKGEDTGVLSPDGRLRAHFSGSNDEKSINVCNVKSGAIHSVWRAKDSFEPVRFEWSPDNAKLAVVVRSATDLGLECWDVNREERLSRWTRLRFDPGDNDLNVLTWSPDGAFVAMEGLGDLGDDGSWIWNSHVHVVDVAAGERRLKHPFGGRQRHGGQILALAWSPDGHSLAQATTEGLVEIIDMNANGAAVRSRTHDAPIRTIAWSPNGQRLATAAADGAVKVIESRQGNELLTLHVQGEGCSLVSWSPDGKQLAAANDAGEIQIWDASRGHEFAEGGDRRRELVWAYYEQADKVRAESRAVYLRKALALAPEALDYRHLRGQVWAQLGEYDEAAREFAAAVPERVEQGLWMARWQARALLGARDIDAYCELQASLVDVVRDSDVWTKRLEVAWLGALLPEITDGFEDCIKHLIALQLKNVQQHDEGISDLWTLQLAAMLYRLGKYNEAQRTLAELAEKLAESADTEGQYILASTKYFLAMTRHKLGHEFQARRQLAEAETIARHLENVNSNWHWQVEFATLHREAEALIGK